VSHQECAPLEPIIAMLPPFRSSQESYNYEEISTPNPYEFSPTPKRATKKNDEEQRAYKHDPININC
jgi:hypothetical protein